MRFLVLLISVTCAGQRVDPVEFFETKVRPVLAKNFFSCHTQTKLGGLEMTSRESLLKGGKSGPAISPDRPEESLLLQAIKRTHERMKMPPPPNAALTADEIKDIERWITRGAVWPPPVGAKTAGPGYKITPQQRAWWAFQPVRKPALPAVKDKTWARVPVDQFVLAALESKGLKPVAQASKREWIRRVTYDLTGLPPAPQDVDAFAADASASARAKVVDRLLASPHFGERWGRYWLDVARYSDDKLNSTQDEPYDNAYRYRDWVIQAMNNDMPFDTFVKAQLAGDLLPDKEKYVAGLGFFALSPQFQDDRVEVTGKAFLALTVACATCHDHKFDPIPTKDYYALLGVFTSTDQGEFPLAPQNVVDEYRARTKAVDESKEKLNKFLDTQAKQLSEVLAERAADYVRAARKVVNESADRKITAAQMKLDDPTLERWVDYLKLPAREHKFLDGWQEEAKLPAEQIQKTLVNVINEWKDVEEKNFIRLGGSMARNDLARADLLSLPRDKWLLWRDVFSNQRHARFTSGILYYKDGVIDRFLSGEWKAHFEGLRAELDRRKKAVPDRYPYYHVIRDRAKPRNERVRIRGSNENLGEEVPRRFLSVLCDDEPQPFQKGSGRLELAEGIASARNPLTSRVFVNRVWHYLFGAGLVRSLSNFGQLGEKPSHPELLDFVAARFIEEGWSLKKLVRELTLSSTYGLSYQTDAKALVSDPDNRLLWHATRRRMDVEALRDALLAASGELDTKAGGAPEPLTMEKNLRRTVYGFVSRRKLDGTLALFDFPNPNSMSEQRIPTATPLQQLYFLNSKFLMDRAEAFSKRLEKEAETDPARIKQAYRILFYREPERAELDAGLAYLKSNPKAWPEYAQVLLSSNEFVFY
ncbi:MAG: PSD1 domain-containing protein [Acidobacteria bacterium]|nr:PSD1 domain-containing protein [Acidobacteriota bacterium]